MSFTASERRAIEWRHGWPLRFAHHPLCARHRHETWRIGRLHLCRGCASLGAGLLAGTTAVLVGGGAWSTVASVLLAPIVLLLSWPAWYARWPRVLRDGLRVSLGVAIATCTHAVFSAPPAWWPLALFGVAAWLVFRRARRRVNARRCDGCPELGHGVCSGYAAHARAMRAIADEIEMRLLANDSQPPACLAHTISADQREPRR